MTETEFERTDGWKLDRLRHNDPKLRRKVRQMGGRVSWAKGLEEDGVAQFGAIDRGRTAAGSRHISFRLSAAEAARWEAGRGHQSHSDHLVHVLDMADRYESFLAEKNAAIDALHDEVATLQAECRGHVAALASAGDELAVSRQYNQAAQDQIVGLVAERDKLVEDHAGVIAEDGSEAREALFDFVQAVTGGTFTLVQNGRIGLEMRLDKPEEIITAWRRGTTVLGLDGK